MTWKRLAIAAAGLAAWLTLAGIIAANNHNHTAAFWDVIWIPLATAAGLALYWLPALIAWRRHARNLGSIAVLTFFTFLTAGITWIVALVMAVADRPTARNQGGLA